MTFLIVLPLALTFRALRSWVRHDSFAVQAKPTCFA